MSIILKGIDMPKGNEPLYISILNGKVYERTASFLEEEIDGTEAIQIPKEHGAIVDMKTFKVDMVDVSTRKVSWTVNQILEAEGEE